MTVDNRSDASQINSDPAERPASRRSLGPRQFGLMWLFGIVAVVAVFLALQKYLGFMALSIFLVVSAFKHFGRAAMPGLIVGTFLGSLFVLPDLFSGDAGLGVIYAPLIFGGAGAYITGGWSTGLFRYTGKW